MFDSVWFKCPNCVRPMEAQSKGGDCQLDSYQPEKVPYDVARGAHIHNPCKCGKAYKIKELVEPAYVELELEEIKDYDGREWL